MSAPYTDAEWIAAREAILSGPFSAASDEATKVLDAVAPAIAARAKAEALRDFAHSLAIARVISDHDPSQSQTSETLTAVIDDMFARADEIEGGAS